MASLQVVALLRRNLRGGERPDHLQHSEAHGVALLLGENQRIMPELSEEIKRGNISGVGPVIRAGDRRRRFQRPPVAKHRQAGENSRKGGDSRR